MTERQSRAWARGEAAAYRRERRGYVTATRALMARLSARLRDIDEITVQVTGRTKEVRSVEQKLRARERDQPGRYSTFRDLSDLIGVRLVVQLESDIAVVAKEVYASFVVEKDVDVRDERGRAMTPGYRGRHLDVRARPDDDLPDLLREHVAEIQVRTVAADLWATVEHELRYKARGVELPARRSRQFVLAASLFELAERELEDLRAWKVDLDRGARGGPELDEAALRDVLERRYPAAAASTARRLAWMLELLRELRLDTAADLGAALPEVPDRRVTALVERRSTVDQVRLLDDELLLSRPDAYLRANRVVPDEHNPHRIATLEQRRRRLTGPGT